MAIDLRNTILSSDDITRELVEVPEWGVTIQLRAMTALERTNLTEGNTDTSALDLGRMYANVVIATVYDPETEAPVFTFADRDAIMSKNGAVIDRLAQKALGSSGVGDKAVEKKAGQFPPTS